MKKGFILVLLVLFSFSAWGNILVGKVDMQKVLLTVAEGKKVRSKLEKAFNSKKDILKKEEDKIRKAQEDYQKQNMVLSEKAKGKKQAEMQNMVMALQNKTLEFQKEIQEMENTLKRPMIDKIREIVVDISKKKNVTMTFEISSAPIVYAKEELDITDEVIEAYNKKHK